MAVPFKRGIMTPERRQDSSPFRHCGPENEYQEDDPHQIFDRKECGRPFPAFPFPKDNQNHDRQQAQHDRLPDYAVHREGVGAILEILD